MGIRDGESHPTTPDRQRARNGRTQSPSKRANLPSTSSRKHIWSKRGTGMSRSRKKMFSACLSWQRSIVSRFGRNGFERKTVRAPVGQRFYDVFVGTDMIKLIRSRSTTSKIASTNPALVGSGTT